MRPLILYCHPDPGSFSAAVRDTIIHHLAQRGTEYRLIDLYAEGFDPVMCATDLAHYADTTRNRSALSHHAEALAWCDALIFVYPTWWQGLPAMLKGWLDRVLLPGIAFDLPTDGGALRPGLRHIRAMGVFTTFGGGRLPSLIAGQPGRRQLQRAVGMLCHPLHRRGYLALYSIDATTPARRAAHLVRVLRKLDRLLR
jgi:putative NADPH-quinone reductase